MLSVERSGRGEVQALEPFHFSEPEGAVDLGARLRELWVDVDVEWTEERAQRIFGRIQVALERRRRQRRWAKLCLAAALPLTAALALGRRAV